MHISLFGGFSTVDQAITEIQAAERDGFHGYWAGQIFGGDTLTQLALAGAQTERIELGTGVVPTYLHHPFSLAQQALTIGEAAGGRFVLGIGPSHQPVVEQMWGLSYEKPARHVREYLQVVNDLLLKGRTEFKGETYQVNGSINVDSGGPCPVLIGALGPVMRRVCGELADGTITWMTGPRTLGETLVPGIRAAAEAVGRPSPRVVCGLPIVLTDDPAGAKEAASKMFAMYGTLPSYRAMLDNEGVSDPGELAIAGDEKTLEAAIRGLASAGVTDFNAAAYPYGPDAKGSLDRTQELLAQLARD